MSRFKDRLLAAIGAELRALGYEYDHASSERNWLFGFRKQLSDNVYAFISFQRTQHNPYGFYINLRRHNASGQDRYDAFQGRLGWLICIGYYGWRRCPPDQDIWNARDESGMDAQVADALEKLKAYGIPFLEDPNSKPPLPLRDYEIAQFRESVMKVVFPELQRQGFEVLTERPYSKNVVCFGKQLWRGLGIFVVFVQGVGESDEELSFHVRLDRNKGTEPVSWPVEEGDLITHLHFLLERKYGLQVVPPTELPIWRYTNAKDLELLLQDVLGKVIEYAIPWLEDPLSTNTDLYPVGSPLQ